MRVGDAVVVWCEADGWGPAGFHASEVTRVDEDGIEVRLGESAGLATWRWFCDEDVTWTRAISGEALDAFKAVVALR